MKVRENSHNFILIAMTEAIRGAIVYTSLIKEGSEPIDYFTVFLRLDLT